MSKLTTESKERLAVLCGIVRKGMETFVEVGNALMEIRESGLYKERCSTFESFVQIEFGFSRQHAYKQIAAAEVVAGMSHSATPESLRSAISLAQLPPEQRQEAFAEATETAKAEGRPKPTSAHVTAAVASRRKDKKKPKYESAADMAAALTKRVPPAVPSEAERSPGKAPEPESVDGVGSTDAIDGASETRIDESVPAPSLDLTPAVRDEGVVPIAPAKPKHTPSAYAVRDAIAGKLNDPTDADGPVLTGTDREWFQAVNRWSQKWMAACPQAQSSAA